MDYPVPKDAYSFSCNQRLNSAIRLLAAAAARVDIGCTLHRVFPTQGTAVQQALWFHQLVTGSAQFAAKCVALAHASGTPVGSNITNAGTAIRLNLDRTLQEFTSDPSPENWSRATREAAELILMLSRVVPALATRQKAKCSDSTEGNSVQLTKD